PLPGGSRSHPSASMIALVRSSLIVFHVLPVAFTVQRLHAPDVAQSVVCIATHDALLVVEGKCVDSGFGFGPGLVLHEQGRSWDGADPPRTEPLLRRDAGRLGADAVIGPGRVLLAPDPAAHAGRDHSAPQRLRDLPRQVTHCAPPRSADTRCRWAA